MHKACAHVDSKRRGKDGECLVVFVLFLKSRDFNARQKQPRKKELLSKIVLLMKLEALTQQCGAESSLLNGIQWLHERNQHVRILSELKN